jgi:hypothetical protein
VITDAIFDYVLRGRLMAPAGTKLNPTGSGIILPDGREVKIWEQLEIHTPDTDDHHDLISVEAEELGLFYDGDCAELTEIALGDDTQLWPPR